VLARVDPGKRGLQSVNQILVAQLLEEGDSSGGGLALLDAEPTILE
jgi:hypothetical protein